MTISKAKIKQVLKERNVTEKQMDEWWQILIDLKHPMAELFTKPQNNLTWRNNWWLLRELSPEFIENYKVQEANRLKEEQTKLAIEEKKKADKKFYEDNMESILVKKIENKERFTESEICNFLYDCGETVDEIEGSDHRWQREISTIKKIGDKYYQLNWMKGLTEYQENSFDYDPFEVEPKEEIKVIKVWKPVKGDI